MKLLSLIFSIGYAGSIYDSKYSSHDPKYGGHDGDARYGGSRYDYSYYGTSDRPAERFIPAEEGGYSKATCKCEIECSPDNINEVCGSDIAIALDMSHCNKDTWTHMQTFVEHLVDEVKLKQELGGAKRSTSRVAVLLFSHNIDRKLQMEEWNGDQEQTEWVYNKLRTTMKAIKRETMWTVYSGSSPSFYKSINWAIEQFDTSRIADAERQMELLGFQTTKTFILVTDGKLIGHDYSEQKREDILDGIREMKERHNSKVITVSQSPECVNGKSGPGCPNSDMLNTLGDMVIDGSDPTEAAREVAHHINSKKCVKYGECKPCNCECELPRGPAGKPGSKGCQGQPGDSGRAGNPGKFGLAGPIGPAGNPGQKGIKGDCGDPGVPGEMGPKGYPAQPGVPAKEGPRGEHGSRGRIGEPGEEGRKGYPGNPGPMGDPGPTGPQGDIGPDGIPGDAGDVILEDGIVTVMITTDVITTLVREFVKEYMELQDNQEMIQCIADCDDRNKTMEGDTNCETGFIKMIENGSVYCDPEPCEDGSQPKLDGNMKPVCPLTGCFEAIDMIFLVDGSDSIREHEWPLVGNWTNTLIDRIAPLDRDQDTNVVYQQYSSAEDFPSPIITTIPSETNPDEAEHVLKRLKSEIERQEQKAKGTDTYHALGQLQHIFERQLRSKPDGNDEITTVLITLTDGAARDQTNRREDMIQALKKRTDIMVAVGVGQGVLEEDLKDISSDQHDILRYNNYQQLYKLAAEIINLISKNCQEKNTTGQFKRQADKINRELETPTNYMSEYPSSIGYPRWPDMYSENPYEIMVDNIDEMFIGPEEYNKNQRY